MTHEDERAVVVEERLLEHFLGLHVEVVGGLVEDQEVVGLEEELQQGKTCALTPAEYLDLLRGSLSPEHKCPQKVLDLRTDLSLGDIVDRLKYRAVLVLDGRLILGEVADGDIVP